jgi:hypothetical protein
MPTFSEAWAAHTAEDHYTVKLENYLHVYDTFLTPFVGRAVTLIEFGIFHGGSLQIWRRMFGPTLRLVGVDCHEPWVNKCRSNGTGAEIFYGNQKNAEFLATLPNPDIIIDDAGHNASEQAACFNVMWPRLNDGGIYVIEDLDCNSPNLIKDTIIPMVLGKYTNQRGAAGCPLHLYPDCLVAEKRQMPRWNIIQKGHQ